MLQEEKLERSKKLISKKDAQARRIVDFRDLQ